MDSNEKTYIKGLGLCAFGNGANVAEVDVKDGKVLRIRPMHYEKEYNLDEFNPWKLEARGKIFDPGTRSLLPPFSLIYKKRAYSPNRILYPLKRVDWDPEGERNPQNRGKSKFVRISWDEATDLIAKELKRVQAAYGPYAVLGQVDGHGQTKAVHGPHGCQVKLLNLMGGFTMQARNADSWEGWYWGAKHVWGRDPIGQGPQTNLLKDISENSEIMLFWGCDPETTPWGWGGQQASRLCYWFSKLGIKSIFICPDLNYGAAVHADKWIPIRPNTDAAMQLAIAYTWMVEDTYDKDYIATHAYGFDKFEDYVMGREDGIPKTSQWAADICGVPSRIIKALARAWAAKATVIAHCNGGSYIRSAYASEPARLEVCLLGMQGLGKPGTGQFKFIEWQHFGLHEQNPAPRSSVIPSIAGAYQGTRFYQMPKQFLPKTLVARAILSEPEEQPLTWWGTSTCRAPRADQFIQYQYPIEEGGSEIHMIWTDTPCWTTCWTNGNKMIDAMRSRKIECVVAQHPWMENDCLFADIILPISTKFEEEDIMVDLFSGQYNTIFYEGKCIDNIGEAKSDYEAVCEVAKKVGLYEEYTQGNSIQDWIKKGFEQSGVAEMISYKEFMDKKYFVCPTAEGWENDKPGFRTFYEDPDNNPLATPTGKLEYYATELAQVFPADEERPPVPHWIPFGKTHNESLLHPKSEKYPFLIVSNHPRWREHANLDDVSWLREIPTCKVKGPDGYLYEPVWINPLDAEAMGIKHGEIVEIFNDRGMVLGGAYITERIMPGVVLQDHGTRIDPIIAGKSDRGGANNLICPGETTSQNCVGEVTSGFLVGVKKADLKSLQAQNPDAFAREYDAAAGLVFDEWVVEGD